MGTAAPSVRCIVGCVSIIKGTTKTSWIGKTEYREKFKLKLVFTAILPRQVELVANDCSSTTGQQEKSSSTPSVATQPTVGCERGMATTTTSIPEQQQAMTVGYSASMQAMKKRLKQAGFKGELVPPPEGEPLFLFQAIQGKNNPVNVFYNKGCSHAVFREGVPLH